MARGDHGEAGGEAVYDDRRWMVALAVVRRDGRVTRRTLAAAAGVSERTATRVLGAMLEAGVVVEDGKRGGGAGYRQAQ